MVAQGKIWRATLNKVKTSKHEGVKELAGTVEEVVDEVTAGLIYCAAETQKQSTRVGHLELGVATATEQAETVIEAQDLIKNEFNALEMRLEEATKQNEALKKRVDHNTVVSHRAEMAKSANVVVCRNIRPVKAGEESYEDIEKAFWTAIKPAKLERHLTINYIGRLQKAPSDHPDAPALIRVVLGSSGQKRKLYDSINELIKRGASFEPSFTNEIPAYALNAHKHLSRIAAHMRRENRQLKTRVSILKGDIWPVISIKVRGQPTYVKIKDDDMQAAREAYLKAAKKESERKKEARLLADDDHMMDASEPSGSGTGPGTGTSGRGRFKAFIMRFLEKFIFTHSLSICLINHILIISFLWNTFRWAQKCQTKIMIKQILLVLLLAQTAQGVDVGHTGRRIILQSDVETIIITLQLDEIKRALVDMIKNTNKIRTSLTAPPNELKQSTSRHYTNLFDSILDTLDQQTTETSIRLESLFVREQEKKYKRAIEILGRLLSKITGVPSANEHRQVLEKVRLLRLDNENINGIIKKQNAENSEIIKTFHLHESDIDDLKKGLAIVNSKWSELATWNLRATAVMSNMAQVLSINGKINTVLETAEQILDKSDFDLLHRSSIDPLALGKIIDNIYLQRKNSTPVFSGSEVSQYYKLGLAHSWAVREDLKILTLLQIPIAPMTDLNTLAILDPINQIHLLF